MSGVIVVDAESFRSTCFGRDAYIHDHRLDILITMLNSVNCSTVICSPTVEYLCSREKPLVKPMAPGSILMISIYITLFICFVFTLPLLFTLHLSIKNSKNIISIRSHSCKWPWRAWQPLYHVGCEDLFVLCRYEGLARSLLLDWYLASKKPREILTLLCCIIPSSSGKSNAVFKR